MHVEFFGYIDMGFAMLHRFFFDTGVVGRLRHNTCGISGIHLLAAVIKL